MVAKNIEWHKANGNLHSFLYYWRNHCDNWYFSISRHLVTNSRAIWRLLTFGMSIVTLSFLIFTPETWVPNLGGDFPTPNYGFPYLSGAGRLVIKDIIMMAGGLTAAAECANRILARKRAA